MIKFLKRYFRKEPVIREKIRLRVKEGRLISVHYPVYMATDFFRYATARQQVQCYEIKLNGHPLCRGLT